MNGNIIIKNTEIINEGKRTFGDILVKNGIIEKIDAQISVPYQIEEVIGESFQAIPGAIDDQVHFREPGLTHKANIFTESGAAAMGGVTSFMEMPNTHPQALTQELLEDKYQIAEKSSFTNYSFFMGASNHNLEEVLKTNPENVCGIKVFMGSSTGDMLVDNMDVLENIFCRSNMLVATHCESESIIRASIELAKSKYGTEIPMWEHPNIRSREACLASSTLAIEIAKKCNSRLHILHITTEEEAFLLDATIPLEKKNITMEACVHHLWFNDQDYLTKGSLIKCNPAIKTEKDRKSIWQALKNGNLDVVATDHAPHTWEEKQNSYLQAPSGLPLIQHSMLMFYDLCLENGENLEFLTQKMAHNVAICFNVRNRGFVKEGYFADIVLFNSAETTKVLKKDLNYKCGWSPIENQELKGKIEKTIINGNIVFDGKKLIENHAGKRLIFS